MTRLVLFILKLALLLGFATWLADRPGEVHIVWRDTIIDTSAAFLAALILALVFSSLALYRFWRFIVQGPRFMRLRRRLYKTQKGQHLLTRGLIAVAAGDAVEAGRLAVQARRMLGPVTATKLLQAQAAQLAGDRRAAHDLYLALSKDSEAAVFGYRGLIREALRENRLGDATRLLEDLQKREPDVPWLALIQFDMAARREDWTQASQKLRLASAAQQLDAAEKKRLQAALSAATARQALIAMKPKEALQAAEKAATLLPAWLPAILMLARAQTVTGHARAAGRTIERAWPHTPHPDLAALYISLDDRVDAMDRFKRMEKLARLNPNHPQSHAAAAEAAIEAQLWGEARRHLTAASNRTASQHVFRLLAQLERRQNDEKAAAAWLARALDAPADPRWLCETCGAVQETWAATCGQCKSFNTLEWRAPGQGHGQRVPLLFARLP